MIIKVRVKLLLWIFWPFGDCSLLCKREIPYFLENLILFIVQKLHTWSFFSLGEVNTWLVSHRISVA